MGEAVKIPHNLYCKKDVFFNIIMNVIIFVILSFSVLMILQW
jgi:hypothetical protein